METPEEYTKIESIFVRHRNALVLRGQFTPIYTDYYLHLMQTGEGKYKLLMISNIIYNKSPFTIYF